MKQPSTNEWPHWPFGDSSDDPGLCPGEGPQHGNKESCDTPVPPVVLRAAAQAMERGKNVYSRFDGLPELRQAIAKKLAQYNGIAADPETDVTVSAGATGSFHCACLALLNPGDEGHPLRAYYQYHISALLRLRRFR